MAMRRVDQRWERPCRTPALGRRGLALALLVALLPLLADGATAATRPDWGTKAPLPTARQRLGLAAAPSGPGAF